MTDRTKHILFVIAFILIAIGLGVLIYWVFFRSPIIPSYPRPTTEQRSGALPSAGVGAPTGKPGEAGGAGLPSAGVIPTIVPPSRSNASPSRTTVLTTSITRAVSGSPGGDGLRFYNPVEGKFYRIRDDGSSTALSSQTFYNVDQVTWGKQSDKAILSYPDGSKTLYDFTSDRQFTLPKHWEEFDFSPTDDQIVSKSVGNNENNRFLVIANPDGTNAHPIEDLGRNQDKVHVSWSPNNQVVAYAFTGEPIGLDRQAVVLVGQHQENFKNLIVEGRGFIPKWSPSGEQILYSVYDSNNGYRPTLWISGAVGDAINSNRRNIAIQTWADKCAWQTESVIFCAVPATLGTGAGLQRDLFANVPDNIYRLDLRTGAATNLGQPDGRPSILQLVPSQDGKAVYFNDRDSGKLVRFSVEP